MFVGWVHSLSFNVVVVLVSDNRPHMLLGLIVRAKRRSSSAEDGSHAKRAKSVDDEPYEPPGLDSITAQEPATPPLPQDNSVPPPLPEGKYTSSHLHLALSALSKRVVRQQYGIVLSQTDICYDVTLLMMLDVHWSSRVFRVSYRTCGWPGVEEYDPTKPLVSLSDNTSNHDNAEDMETEEEAYDPIVSAYSLADSHTLNAEDVPGKSLSLYLPVL